MIIPLNPESSHCGYRSGPSWHYLNAFFVDDGSVVWQHGVTDPPSPHDEDEAFVLRILGLPEMVGPHGLRPKAVAEVRELFHRNGITCFDTEGDARWRIDLDQLMAYYPNGRPYEWLTGIIHPISNSVSPSYQGERGFQFNLTKRRVERTSIGEDVADLPATIGDSYKRFRADHRDPAKAAFIMMQFSRTPAHDAIVKVIRKVLDNFGMAGLRADDKQYHDDLFRNVHLSPCIHNRPLVGI